jgi:hypothetical protein
MRGACGNESERGRGRETNSFFHPFRGSGGGVALLAGGDLGEHFKELCVLVWLLALTALILFKK